MSDDRETEPKPAPKNPHFMWYVAHAFFWVITGLICYLLYKDTNPKAARKHLITSIWLSFAIWLGISLIGGLLYPLAIGPDSFSI